MVGLLAKIGYHSGSGLVAWCKRGTALQAGRARGFNRDFELLSNGFTAPTMRALSQVPAWSGRLNRVNQLGDTKMKTFKIGDKVVVFDAEFGDVEGVVVSFALDGNPMAKFSDGTVVVIHPDMVKK